MSDGSQDEEDTQIDKLAKLSQDNLNTKLVNYMQREQELAKLSKAPYQHVLVAAQKDLLTKNAQPPADATYIVDTDGNRAPVLSDEWKAAKEAKDKKIKKSLEIVNGCVDKIVKLDQPKMLQVLYDIAEHLLAQETTYAAELEDTRSNIDLCQRASTADTTTRTLYTLARSHLTMTFPQPVERKIQISVDEKRRKLMQRIDRKFQVKAEPSASAKKRRKSSVAGSVYSMTAGK